ncbi:MAG: hypothetical protein JRI72_01245 [Deltaproteobacteria bacterium]|nr:hypothetical protein [Deltaproteobacteria bacterium]
MTKYEDNSLKESFVKAASEKGWKYALKEYSGKYSLPKIIYIDDYYRILWRFLLPLTKSCNVLYVGYDWGIQLQYLARQIGTLTVATSSETKIAFLQLVRDQCGLKNIFFIKLDDMNSFRQKGVTFDILILDGYSEWLDNQDRDQMWLQFKALLKQGGCVLCNTDMISWTHRMVSWLITKNILFKDLPPALWLASKKTLLTSISRRSREYMAYWGFEGTKVYLSLPHYQNSKVILPIDNYETFSYFIKHWAQSRRYHINNPIIRALLQFASPLWWLFYWSLDRLSPHASIITWKVKS